MAAVARGAAGPGEGRHEGPGRAGRRAPAPADDRVLDRLPLRRPGRRARLPRPVRRPQPADRLPLLASPWRPSLRRLLDVHRPGQPARPPERPRRLVGAHLHRAAGRDRRGQGPQRLVGALVHDRRERVPGGLRDDGLLRARRLPPRRRPGLPHLRDAQSRRRGAGQHLDVPRPDPVRAPGGVGGQPARAARRRRPTAGGAGPAGTSHLTRSPGRAFQCHGHALDRLRQPDRPAHPGGRRRGAHRPALSRRRRRPRRAARRRIRRGNSSAR